MMASALRKLFKSSDKIKQEENRKNNGDSSPGKHFSAKKLFGRSEGLGRSESPRVARRDYKISPADAPPVPTCASLKSKFSGRPDNVVKHNQTVRTRRLMREYHEICKSMSGMEKPPFSVELVDDCLYEWNIRLYQIDPESDLYRDMVETNTTSILLNVTFPDNFPFSPPFMRVISPHIEKGFVMEGGAICMELLTPRGWASAYTVEAVILQFAASLIKGQGRISRKYKSGKEFTKKLAEASFRSLVKTHDKYGWVTPPLTDG